MDHDRVNDRVETHVAMEALLERCRDIEIDGPEPSWRDNVRMRGLTALPIRYRAA